MQNETDFVPPSPVVSDYIESLYLFIIFLVGTPSNIYILRRLILEIERTPRDTVRYGFLLLKINLNISDIVLLSTAFFKCIWIYNYQWPGNDLMCRLYQYVSMLGLYISTNMVLCISIDRLRNVLGAEKMHSSHNHLLPVKAMIGCAWGGAAILSLPQLVLFRTFDISDNPQEPWIQCTDVWQIGRAFNVKLLPDVFMSSSFRNEYNITHLTLVFWGPLLVLLVVYFYIASRLIAYSARGVREQDERLCSTTELHKLSVAPEAETVVAIPESPSKKNKFFCCSSHTEVPMVDIQKSHSSQPHWRRRLRSKTFRYSSWSIQVFRATIAVVAVHFVFWTPYNVYALMQYINPKLYELFSEKANIFKDMQILITLINPFLYGFTR